MDSESEDAHYHLFKQADVIPNFRVIGIWDNPWLSGGNPQDMLRPIPVLCEGLMITYLDMYSGNPQSRNVPHPYRPSASFELDRMLREGLELPRLG
jgi:hypothetical protein